MNRIDRSMKRRRHAARMEQMKADPIYWFSLALALTVLVMR